MDSVAPGAGGSALVSVGCQGHSELPPATAARDPQPLAGRLPVLSWPHLHLSKHGGIHARVSGSNLGLQRGAGRGHAGPAGQAGSGDSDSIRGCYELPESCRAARVG
jgi:hypothetical protein